MKTKSAGMEQKDLVAQWLEREVLSESLDLKLSDENNVGRYRPMPQDT